jgi:hypothetical protein
MADYLNYLNENEGFQQFKQFTEEQKEEYKAREGQAVGELGLSVPLLGNVYTRGTEALSKIKGVATKGQEAVSTLKSNVEKVKSSVEEAGQKLKGVVSKGETLGEETIGKAEGLAGKAQDLGLDTISKAQGFKSSLVKRGMALNHDIMDRADPAQTLEDLRSSASSVVKRGMGGLSNELSTAKANYSATGRKMATKMFDNHFELDPESQIADVDLSEGKGALFKLQSAFRSGTKPMQLPDSVGQSVQDTLQNSKTTAMNTVKGIMGRASTEGKGAVSGLQTTGEQLVNQAKSKAGDIAGLAQEGAEKLSAEALKQAGDVGSKATGLAGEAGEAIGETAGKVASLAGEAGEAVTGVAEAVGGAVAESIPVIGELVGAGLGLADLFTSIEDKPHIPQVATPHFVAGV